MSDLSPMHNDATYWDATRVWWSFIWRSTLFSMLASMGIGLVLGFIAAAAGVGDAVKPFLYIVGLPLAIFLNLWSMRKALNKKYGDFKLVIQRD